ncbi:MAG: DUF4139 domain-containing protein [Caldilineales bacterium]|nr:DUF4139 domain-containing protein [Caldilineales bacterium]
MKKNILISLAAGAVIVSAGLVLALAATSPTRVGAQGDGVDLTVYNSNIALVKESRQFDLDEGVNNVAVTDVPSAIIPETVYFKSLTDPDAVVLEQNYEYDIVGSQKLLEKYIDQPIRVVTQDGTVYEGTLLSGQGDVILQEEDGGVVVVKFEQIQQYSFPALPDGLITKPTLVWMVNATESGNHNAEIAYLTNGLNWAADYVLVLAQDNESLDLTGWVTLDNRSGATYEDARLKLVAGDINRVQEPQVYYDMVVEERAMAAAAPAPQVSQREFFEYHLYEINRPVTLKDNQTKQVEFVSAAGVPANKEFIYDASQPYMAYGPIFDPGYGQTGQTKVDVSLTFNTGEDGVDAQLPKGTIRMYQADVDGSPLLIGEDSIDHTPKGEDVTLVIGQAFDLVGERKQTNFNRIGDRVVEESYEITLRNQKEDEAVDIRVVEHLSRWSDWEIIDTNNEDFTKTDSNTIEWIVTVPAKGSQTISYTVRYEF